MKKGCLIWIITGVIIALVVLGIVLLGYKGI